MRWDNLSPAARAVVPLPLPDAAARSFDAPGFAGMTFHEVRAESIINRVPFEWTVNPYRGRTHACGFCLSGETPILMVDGSTRPLARLRVGDAIYGTVREGPHRRYVPTSVQAHWSTVKPAYRLALADGTKLITSGDHRFLTDRGWKHVTGARSGAARRPYLTTGNTLIGTGRFAEGPKPTTDYRLGYLCGLIRGAAVAGRPARLADPAGPGLRRAREYLAGFGVDARTARSDRIGAIGDVVRWPASPADTWRKGFLAGVFDAGGGRRRHTLRVGQSDDLLIRQVRTALSRFRFDATVEAPGAVEAPGGAVASVRSIRIRGGLGEQMRFRHLVDPAIVTAWDLTGVAIRTRADLRVVEAEPLGLELPLYDITTGTGDFIANGVVSHNCRRRGCGERPCGTAWSTPTRPPTGSRAPTCRQSSPLCCSPIPRQIP